MPDQAEKPLQSRFPHSGLKPAVLALAIATAFGALSARAQAQTLPSGGVAVHGQALITQPAANQLRVVTQNGAGTSHSAINWQSFSISAGAAATIVQPTASSLSINRVVTNTPSAIFGNLSSNGRLVLVNQSGIAVGAGAVVDTAGFTASALRMSDADALAGRLRFGEPGAAMGGAAGLTVGGRITARDGDIVLVAPNIDMGGSALLQAPNGSTILAAGQQVEITGRGLEGITMLVQAPTDQARNLGRLEGNAVGIFAGTLRHSGDIQATTASLEGGTVVLRAAGDAYVDAAGSIDATGTRGGKVDVLGSRVAVTDQAAIDVSGDNAGGSIRIGGDFQGRNPGIPNAQKTFLGPQATLRADATGNGDGGRVIVWSDDYTQAHGTVSARGGLSGGNGGFVEVSGKRSLAFSALVDTRAPLGLTGTLLLDPDFINIEVIGGSYTGDVLFGSGPAELTISAATINASLSNVILQANEDIDFNVAVSLANPGVSLTARAGGFLNVNGSITTKGGAVNLTAGDAGSVTNPSEGSLNLNQPIDTTGGGAFPAGAPVTLTSNLSDVGGNSIFINAGINAGSSLSITAAGGFTVNAPVNALGTINATVINDFVTTINRDVIAGGTMTMNLAGGLELPAIDQSARLGAGTGQTINAKYVALTVAGAGTSEIYNVSGPQTITTSGQNANGEGILIRNTGNDNDTADIYNNGGAQTITVNNASAVRIQGISGAAEIGSAGDQTILIRGNSSANALVIGSATATGDSEVWGNNQTITVGEAGQSGSITIRGGVRDDFDAGIDNYSGNQTIKTSGAMALYGGTAAGVGADCQFASGAHGGSCAYIASDTGVQTLVAGDIRLFGGTAGSLNLAGIINFASTGSQLLEIEGGGDLVLSGGGGSGTGNRVIVSTEGTSQTVSFLAGGDLTITGGTVGTAHRAQLRMGNASGTQTVSGATGIQISGGLSGGGFDVGNRALLTSLGSQVVSVGSGGIQLTGGGGTGVETDNDAQIYQSGTTGTTQSITVGGGGFIQMTGGSSERVNVGGAGHGSRALIEALGDSQTIHFAAGGSLGLFGGILGSRAFATIVATNGSQSITGGPSISLVGGASGGFTNEGNRARIAAPVGVQTIVASDIYLEGGEGGLLNAAELSGAAGQNITASGGITLRGGNGSGSHASIKSSGSQQVTVGNGGISMTGGGGSQADNYAVIDHAGSVGTSQLITVNGTGNISLQAGSALGGQSEAAIRSDFGASQTILFTGTGLGRAINLTGGTAGPDSYAEIYTDSGVQLIEGAGLITLTGGASGGGASFGDGDTLGNVAGIVADSNHQTIVARGMVLQGGAGGLNNFAAVYAGGNQSITLGADGLFLAGGSGGPSDLKNAAFVYKGGDVPNTTQTIRIGGGGTVTLLGGSASRANVGTDANLAGLSNGAFAAIRSEGVAQLIEFTEPGGSIEMSGGTVGSDNHALIFALSGTQTIRGSSADNAPALVLEGGLSGGVVNEGNRAGIFSLVGNQAVTARDITLFGGVGAGAENVAQIRQGDASNGLGSTQTVTVTGGGGIVLQGGDGNTHFARIRAFGTAQTISFSAGGYIDATGGSGGVDSLAQIIAHNGDQFVTGMTAVNLQGGSGGTNNRAQITAPLGSQTLSVGSEGLTLTGGSGSAGETGNYASLFQGGTTGKSQTITVGGGGNITLVAGDSAGTGIGLDNGSLAYITNQGDSQLIEFSGAGSTISITGGTTGSFNEAGILASFGSQTIRGTTAGNAPGIFLTGGASGGIANEGNRAAIIAEAGNQAISAASIALQGGAAGTWNAAQIRQGSVSTGLSSTQVIDIVTSATSALQGGGGVTNLARIQAYGTAQTLELAAGSTLNLSGGTGASFNFARIEALNGIQTIAGSGAISVVGGASGGASGEGNFADIRSRGTSNTQSISARSLSIAGGAGGIENDASVRADGNQTVSLETSGANALVVGNPGAAHASSLTGNNQTITAGSGIQSGSITIVGGTVAGKNAGIFANVVTPNSGTQTISTTGSLSLTGGTATGTSTCDAANSGACADIANDGSGLQTITANAVQMQGGASGIANGAGIFQRGGDLLLKVGAGGLTMAGGSGGSNNFTTIGGSNANGSTLTLDVTGNIVMDSLSATTGSGALIGLGGVGSGSTVTIDIATSGALTMRGSDVAATGSAIGANNTQTASTTNIDIDAASISLVGGSAGPTLIGSSPLLPGGGNVSLLATGAVSVQGAVAGSAVIHTLGRVEVEGNTLDIRNTVFGNEVSMLGTAGVSLSGAASVNANATGTALKVIVDAGAFSNTASANPLGAPNGRWLVYSVNPVNDTRGSLAYDFKQYGALPASTVLGSGNGLLYSRPAPSVTATLVGVVSKTYDGTNVATLGAGNYIAAGIDGDVIQLNNPSAGTYDTKGVGTSKQVVAGGLSIASSVDASSRPVFGYNPVVAPASGLVGVISAATITGITGITAAKVYDGGTSATAVTSGATFTGAVPGDTLGVTATGASFSDKNVGTGKVVTATGLTLNGPDAANYTLANGSSTGTGTITQRAVATWSGAGGDGLWSNPLNWDAIPDGSNVATVSIPDGAGTVLHDAAGVNIQRLESGRAVLQNTQGSFITPQLTLVTRAGATLGNSANQIGALNASNTVTGNLVIANTGALQVQQLINSAGSIALTNIGAITTIGAVAATPATGNVVITANSPLVVGAGGVTAGNDITLTASNLTSTGNMTLNGPITAGNAVFLDAGGSLTQNSAVLGANGVTADAGLSIVYGPLATANFDPVVYRINGVVTDSPPTETLLGSGAAEATERPVDALVTFVSLLQQASDPAAPPEPDDFNADGTRKKATDDTIVTEGEVCK